MKDSIPNLLRTSFDRRKQIKSLHMKIVFLDAFTTNPGDLSWDQLHACGELTFHDRTPPEMILDRSKDADIIITNKVPFSEFTIQSLPNLKAICVAATGYNHIDTAAAGKRGIQVYNVAGYSTDSVAQQVFALLLGLVNRIETYSFEAHRGIWSQSSDFAYWRKPIMELAGNTFGILGFGKTGQAVARIALAMNMKVIVHHKHPEKDKMESVTFVGFEELIRSSDILSIHIPFYPEYRAMFNKELFRKMKPSSMLINTSRGLVINEEELAQALKEGLISGAGLDVMCQEPPEKDNPLFGLKNCLISPHQAWATQAARKRLLDGIISNIRSFQQNKPSGIM